VQPETRYARSGAVSIAYQVAGEGPFDLVRVPGWVSHVELGWAAPPFDRILRRLASFCRLIVFDKRGTGMSDRVSGAPTLETRMDDLRAVMDAAGSARAAVLGLSEGAPMSLLFAATYPERTTALILVGGFARSLWAPDYPWGKTEEQERAEREAMQGLFRSREEAERVVRTIGNYTGEEVRLLADYYRRSASPGALEALQLMNCEIDVRHVLPAIGVPVLIVHGTEDTVAPIGGARYMADQIAGARFVEIPGGRQSMAGDELDRGRACPCHPLRVRDCRECARARHRGASRPAHRRMRTGRRQGGRDRCPHRGAGGRGSRSRRGARLKHGQGPRRRLRPCVLRPRPTSAEGRSRRVAALCGRAKLVVVFPPNGDTRTSFLGAQRSR
jgi:pimeloyl-ACP methyl ester carboxylesterase